MNNFCYFPLEYEVGKEERGKGRHEGRHEWKTPEKNNGKRNQRNTKEFSPNSALAVYAEAK
jgi:hypothetical protein